MEGQNMPIIIKPSEQACGAEITGLDLSQPLTSETIAEIRAAWLEHHVLVFPEQILTNDDLERFTYSFGAVAEDPFIQPIAGREHIIAVQRRADETTSIFADVWHTDWSFQQNPPIGTCLYGITIPPIGGNTDFANQKLAYASMPAELKAKLAGKIAIHSATGGYSPDGLYSDADAEADRSMKIVVSDDARETQNHPLVQAHPESGKEGVYGCLGYIVGIDGLDQTDTFNLLMELHEWQTKAEFVYSHPWQENMLVMWDNRSVLHKANGGYEGYDRLLHRTTIGAG
jgi:taurine dioxygenase